MNSETERRIKGWFYKSEPDYFSSFTTLWIAFNAYYKAYYSDRNGGKSYSNGRGIAEIKGSNEHYELVKKLVKDDEDFRCNLQFLADVLKDQLLQNMQHENQSLRLPEESLDEHSDISLNFYKKLVEVLYTIRNNLFHGDKKIISERDGRLVELAYKILHGFMSDIIEGNFTLMRQTR